MTTASRFVMIVLVVLGILAIVAGIIYYVEPANSLPSFFPGHLAHFTGKHTKRGLAGIVVGVVLLIIGVVVSRSGRRSARY
jgi:uncharacterized membrane protein